MSKIKDIVMDKMNSDNPIKFIRIKSCPRVAVFSDHSGEVEEYFELDFEQLKNRMQALSKKGYDITEERMAYAGFQLNGTTCYDVAMKIIKNWLSKDKKFIAGNDEL